MFSFFCQYSLEHLRQKIPKGCKECKDFGLKVNLDKCVVMNIRKKTACVEKKKCKL
jgi:hypothetical protein